MQFLWNWWRNNSDSPTQECGTFSYIRALWARTHSDISLTAHCLLRKLTVNLPLGGSHIIPFRWRCRINSISSLAIFHDVTGLQFPLATLPSSGSQKSSFFGTRIFHLCRRHNIIWPKVNIISSNARTSFLIPSAQMNEVELRANEVAASRKRCDASHQWCGLLPNDVALRATESCNFILWAQKA